jgi:hypothetical protein
MSNLPPIDPLEPDRGDPEGNPPPPKTNGHDPNPQSNGIESAVAGVSVSFTRYDALGTRLSKSYDIGADGKVTKSGRTEMGSGEYETITIEEACPPQVLGKIGKRIDVLGPCEAIGLGVVIDDLPRCGDITTKWRYELCHGNPRSTLKDAIPRAKSHFKWPSKGLGLLFCDGDEIDGLHEVLTSLWPGFADVAVLARPSASASVKDPTTGMRFKTGEHLFMLNDEPSKTKAVLQAILRLAWCVGSGRSAGWVALAKDGDPLVYGPVDVTVWGTERLIYEGEITLGEGLERLPRNSAVIGGNGVLCAAKLIRFADKHAPVERFNELVAAAKAEPAFRAKQAEVKAAYREEHIAREVARGIPREEVEREFDRVTRASGSVTGERIWRELSKHQTLYWPNGKPFTTADMATDPQAFHEKECADPVEGMTYQTTNCGWIIYEGGRIVIYSRAHGDAYAYFLPLLDMDDLGGELAKLMFNKHNEADEEDEADEEAGSDDEIDTVVGVANPTSGEASKTPDNTGAGTPGDVPPSAPGEGSAPRWMNVMLSIPEPALFGSSADIYTDTDTGATYGPFNGDKALLTAFLIRCVRENIPDETILGVCFHDGFKGSAIHSYCREQGRGFLEQRLKLAKETAAEAEDDADQTGTPEASKDGITIGDFYAYSPQHTYIFAPVGEIWIQTSINERLPKVPVFKKDGTPALDSTGKPRKMTPSRWLGKNRAVEQMTWAPGLGDQG